MVLYTATHRNLKITASADRAELFQLVGVALTKWELVEEALADLYCTIVGGDKPAARRAYGVVISSQSRMEMILAACEASANLSAKRRDAVEKLISGSIRKLSTTRNEIAHATIDEVLSEQDEAQGFLLFPPTYGYRKNAWPPNARCVYDASFLREYVQSCDEAYLRARHFASLMDWGETGGLAGPR